MTLLAEPVEDRSNVPDKIWEATKALLATSPPSNPIILMNVAEWWYKNGKGTNDPAFRYSIRWMDYIINDNIASGGKGNDYDLYADLRDYLDQLRETEVDQ